MNTRQQHYSSLRIMIVDDNDMIRSYLRTALTTTGVNVVAELSRGLDAILQFATCRPDIVFLDINLPDINGQQVLEQILQFHTAAYVIMVSGHNSIENVRNALNSGARGFIVKPFTTQKLIESIDRFLSMSQSRQTTS